MIIALRAVLHGRGSGSNRNFYGLEIPYTSILVLIGAVIGAAVIAYSARLFYFWRSGHDRAAKLLTESLMTAATRKLSPKLAFVAVLTCLLDNRVLAALNDADNVRNVVAGFATSWNRHDIHRS